MGNIASGKSTVAAACKHLGITTISADQIAKELSAQGQPAQASMVAHFGDEIVTATGDLNRRLMRDIIFRDPAQRIWLEELLHPLIRLQIEQDIKNINSAYCLIEIPLLRDKAAYPYLNRILLVLAEREQQIIRLMNRDGSSREQALAILATQADEQSQRALADDIVFNNGSLGELELQVKALHEQYLKAANVIPRK